MFSLPVAVTLILCLFATTAPATDWSEVSEDAISFTSIEEESIRTANVEEQKDPALKEPECDCGPNSDGCKTENGTKICKCKYSYRQENGFCEAFCEDHWRCDNGGKCINESCQCLPGTSGDFCKTVEECKGMKGPLLCGDPDKALCWFDVKTQKPYCRCRIYDYIFYPKLRQCIECDCGDAGSCSLVEGKKTCKCNEGAALRKESSWGDIVDRCQVCNCGNNSNGCSFSGLYDKVCDCKKGYAQQPDLYGDACNECNCGPNGKCYFRGWYRYCNCDEGYKPFLTINSTDLYCKECDCGKNGVCSFKEEVKQCKCNPGYALRDGICTACQCYVGNETAPCTFTDKIQKCECPDGYEVTKFICKDIDECLNSSNSCPSTTTDCLNTMGSYECVCKEGYEPRYPGSDPQRDGCEDIDECENEDLCPRNHTICTNLPGSYTCKCDNGYVVVPPNIHPKDAGCEKPQEKEDDSPSSLKIVLIVLGVILGIFVIGIAAFVLVKQRSERRSRQATDTTLEYMK